MCQNPWLVHSGWLICNIKCLLSSTPACSVSLCFANARDTDMCFDFDPVNQNCSSSRSWSRFGQQRDGSQVRSETHICVDEPLFSVVPSAGLGATAHAGSTGAGQSWTQHSAFQNVSPWSLVKMEMLLLLSLQYHDTRTGVFLAEIPWISCCILLRKKCQNRKERSACSLSPHFHPAPPSYLTSNLPLGEGRSQSHKPGWTTSAARRWLTLGPSHQVALCTPGSCGDRQAS